jgi:hypothetical protein
MTASLLVFVPVALLVLISGFGFVGCVLDTHGTGVDPNKPDPENPDPKPLATYSNDDVLAEPSVVAYWPLDEKSPADDSVTLPAHDAAGANDGEYIHKGNEPKLFPCPGYEITPGLHTAQAFGTLSLGVESIVPGDIKKPFTDANAPTTGMQVDGAFVTVPVSSTVNQSGPFTVEVWVRREWVIGDLAKRILVDSHNDTGSMGFVIGVSEVGNWEASFGYGTGFLQVSTGTQAAPNAKTHVVVTFDGQAAAIFVNGNRVSQPVSLPDGATYVPNTTTAFVVGVGLPGLTPRSQPSDQFFFPLLPFKGTIQDVAIYSSVLPDQLITDHFLHGSTKPQP